MSARHIIQYAKHDYVITEVSYDSDHSRITHVKRAVYDNSENTFGSESVTSRQTVVNSITLFGSRLLVG